MKSKLKKISVTAAVIFFAAVALLTYFSDTIDHMLLPQVKVTAPILSDLTGNVFVENRYLIPKSTLADSSIYAVEQIPETPTYYVHELIVNVLDSDDMYYEVQGEINSQMKIVYSTSKDIKDGDRVYIAEEE